MHLTATHHHFAIRPLLLGLALLVPSVSGSQPSASDSDGSTSADTTTCPSPETGLEKIDYPSRLRNAIDLALKAKEMNEAGSPLTEEAYLFAARELLGCLLFETEFLVKGMDIDDREPTESSNAVFLLEDCLEEAEKHGADRLAVGEIYYGMSLMFAKYAASYQKEGDESMASRIGMLALEYMQKAQDRGDARADAFMRSH